MKKLLILLLLLISVEGFSQIVINEVMYTPAAPVKEWFEIYNITNSPVNIQNWKWKDGATTITYRTITTQSISIPPNGYAIVCDDSVNLKQSYPQLTGIILQSSGWSLLNNEGDAIVIVNSSSIKIDSLNYLKSWGGDIAGFSLERINPNGLTNQQSNWGTSIDPLKSTPNRLNSLTPKQNDLYLKSFIISPAFPLPGDTLKLNFEIKNIGLNSASNFALNIYKDVNFDSIPQPSELLNSQLFTNTLNTKDSIFYLYNIANIDSGKKQYIGNLLYNLDEDTTNNKLVKNVNVGARGILINEIMYSPQSPEPEWVEIYNNSQNPVNIKNWKFADESIQNSPIIITTTDRIINANDYLVLSKNNSILQFHQNIDSSKIIYLSNLPPLNNDKDKIIIFNSETQKIDEVYYRDSWGGSSRNSLERISFLSQSQDSTNWITSLDCEFSSPTRVNSYANIIPGNRNDLLINEIMFDPLTISCEYFELYNNSGQYKNLNGWKAVIGTTNINIFINCNTVIKPGGFVVVASDSTIYNRFSYLTASDSNRIIIFNSSLSLTNSGTSIKIKDVQNHLIDSVYYNPKWHNNNLGDTKGYSLERINYGIPTVTPTNWSSSAAPAGGTPGLKNSIYVQNNSETSLSITPNPFSPDGDGFEDFAIIKYKLKANTSQVRIKIFDVKGRVVKTLLNNQFSNSESQIIFDGKDENGEKLRVGIYIVYLEAVDDRGGTLEQTKATFVVAAKL